MKYNIIDVDILLHTEGYIDSIFDGIKVDNSDGNSEGIPVGTSNDATLSLIDSTVRGVADYFKF